MFEKEHCKLNDHEPQENKKVCLDKKTSSEPDSSKPEAFWMLFITVTLTVAKVTSRWMFDIDSKFTMDV